MSSNRRSTTRQDLERNLVRTVVFETKSDGVRTEAFQESWLPNEYIGTAVNLHTVFLLGRDVAGYEKYHRCWASGGREDTEGTTCVMKVQMASNLGQGEIQWVDVAYTVNELDGEGLLFTPVRPVEDADVVAAVRETLGEDDGYVTAPGTPFTQTPPPRRVEFRSAKRLSRPDV